MPRLPLGVDAQLAVAQDMLVLRQEEGAVSKRAHRSLRLADAELRMVEGEDMADARGRKQRRAIKAILKFGTSARPTHKSPSGRTGKVRASQLKGLRHQKDRRA